MANKVPKGWSRVALGEIVRPTRSRVHPREFPSLSYIGLEHIESHTMRLLGSSPARKVSSTCTKFDAGDVLYARMRPNLNKVWAADREGLCSTEFIVLPRSPDLNSQFLAFRLNASDFVAFAVQQVAGDRPRVSFEQIASFEIELPPLEEQWRIIAKRERKLARVNRGLENLDRAQARLEDYRESVESAAVTGTLRLKHKRDRAAAGQIGPEALKKSLAQERAAKVANSRRGQRAEAELPFEGHLADVTPPETLNAPPLPEDWLWASIDELSWDAGYGTSTKCTPDAKGSPVLRIPNVQGGKIDMSDLKFAIDPDAVGPGNWVEPGDLLVIRTNGSKELVGRAALVATAPSRPTGFASYLIRFRLVGERTLWEWVSLVWNSRAYRPILQSIASTTAGQYNVSVSGLRSFPVPLPPVAKQLDMLYEVEQRLASAGRLQERIGQQAVRARKQREALIVSAFKGDFVEQVDTEEPASELVERLKAGREIAARVLKEAKMKSRGGSKSKRATIRPLYETLKQHGGPMAPEDLFAEAGFEAAFRKSNYDQSIVDDFYEQLHGLLRTTPGIRPVRPDEHTVLLEPTP
jgi:type I restriction enzyme, S subunit